jgi:hypothetical protein
LQPMNSSPNAALEKRSTATLLLSIWPVALVERSESRATQCWLTILAPGWTLRELQRYAHLFTLSNGIVVGGTTSKHRLDQFALCISTS